MKKFFGNKDRKRKKLKDHFTPKVAAKRQDSGSLIEGILQLRGHFGFVLSEQSGVADIYVSGSSLSQAMDGDRVAVQIIPGRRREGAIVKVIQRARSTAVGIFRLLHEQPMLVLQDEHAAPMRILDLNHLKPKDGQAAVLKITQWPGEQQRAGGILQEILGWPNDPGVDLRMILKQRELEIDFPENVLAECEAMPSAVPAQAWAKRRNFFEIPVFTIDGADAKDFDDAVSLEKGAGESYRLGVHIADASEYVKLSSALDAEGRARATSV